MAHRFAWLLFVPFLTVTLPAQEKQKPTKAEQRETAKRLAATFEHPQYHTLTAHGFKKLGAIGLPAVVDALRKGTTTQARGALESLVAIQTTQNRILTQIEWVLTHRPEVIAARRGGRVVVQYLASVIDKEDRAIDALWRMYGGPFDRHVLQTLSRVGSERTVLLRHVARALDSGDEDRVAKAMRFLKTNRRFARPVSDAVGKAIDTFLKDAEKGEKELQKLSRDRATRWDAREFLRGFSGLHGFRQREDTPESDAAILTRLIGMLDLDALRDRAVVELGRVGAPAIPRLEKALGGDDALVVEGAVRALARMQQPPAKVGELLRQTVTDRSKPREARITGLGALGRVMDADDAAFQTICKCIEEREPAAVRIAAIRQLGHTKKRRHEVVNLFEVAGRTKQVEVAEFLTTMLGVIARKQDQRILMLLNRQLQHDNHRVQRAAVYALAGKGMRVQLERLAKKPGLHTAVKDSLASVLTNKKKDLAGFLIADYSDNRVVQIDIEGNVVSKIEEIFGVWDAEILDNGNFLITEFSVNRVTEMTPDGEAVWSFKKLKNPYDADRLRNGNTLIADTFGRRVIEVDKLGEVVWKYDTDIHPYDVDRLPNGNTLIADTKQDRVIEVTPAGKIVWEIQKVPNVHDADRLPNGNTLLTIRMLNEVREVDKDGKTVWRLANLSSPSDADRLPNGHTIVAENGFVRTFDAEGDEVAKREITWAVEVTPVWKFQLAAQKAARKK